MTKKRKKIIEPSIEKLSPEDKKKIEDFLRSQARLIIDCFEKDKVNGRV